MVTIHYFRFNEILVLMVREGKLSNIERETLLEKAGLLRLEDNKWKQEDGSILSLMTP
jgi:hypothetical protein